MATKTFQFGNDGIDAGISAAAEWGNPTHTGQGHNLNYPTGDSNQINFTAIGTDCSLNCFGNAAGNTFTYIVDGGSVQTATPGATYTAFSLFSGLTDGPHTVQLNFGATSASAVWVDRTTSINVTGAAPALSYSPGYGPVYHLDAPGISFEGKWGSGLWNDTVALLQYGSTWADDKIRFIVKAEEIKIFISTQVAAAWNTQLNDANAGIGTAPGATKTYGWQTIASGLSPAEETTVAVGPNFPPALAVVYVMTVGGALVNEAQTIRDLYAFYGDSITASVQPSNADGTGSTGIIDGEGSGRAIYSSFPHLFGGWNHVAIANRGLGGTTVQPINNTANGGALAPACGQNRTADVTGLPVSPKVIVVEYGTNDMPAGAFSAAPSSFIDAYQSMLTSLVAGCPNSKILCLLILPRGGYDPGTIASYNAAIAASILAVGNSHVQYIDPTSWLIFPDDYQNTGSGSETHPDTVGAYKIAKALTIAMQQKFGLLLPVDAESANESFAATGGLASLGTRTTSAIHAALEINGTPIRGLVAHIYIREVSGTDPGALFYIQSSDDGLEFTTIGHVEEAPVSSVGEYTIPFKTQSLFVRLVSVISGGMASFKYEANVLPS